jgi:NaMN:DMB phosphoribosyltransferase
MPDNPHILKNRVISQGLTSAGIKRGDLKSNPFKAISILGDPMLPSISGIAAGVLGSGGKVMLAGGTQMTAVIAILKSLDQPLDNICIGTTVYVARDQTSDLVGLTETLSENAVPVYASNLHMEESSIDGLQAFSKGYVKDGVGAGGMSIAAILKLSGRINGENLLYYIEREYNRLVSSRRNTQASL